MLSAVAAWGLLLAGGATTTLGLLNIRGLYRTNQTTTVKAVDLMKDVELRDTSISELEASLKPEETRFPVIVRGTVHCWGEDGKPLKGPMSGAESCYYKVLHFGRPFEEKMLPLFLRDKENPNIGIYVPWEKLYYRDDDFNITMNSSYAPPPYQGQMEELFVPHGASFVAVGEAWKNGQRLELRPREGVPKSLYLQEAESQWEISNYVDGYKTVAKWGAVASFAISAALFWGGWALRQRANRESSQH